MKDLESMMGGILEAITEVDPEMGAVILLFPKDKTKFYVLAGSNVEAATATGVILSLAKKLKKGEAIGKVKLTDLVSQN